MFDPWELVCVTHQWIADNIPPIYDTHGLEMSIWKEQNDPMYYLAEDHIYNEFDHEYIESNHRADNYLDEYDTEYNDNDTSESEYEDDS